MVCEDKLKPIVFHPVENSLKNDSTFFSFHIIQTQEKCASYTIFVVVADAIMA